jgi:cyclopropane-fatty-acyl-phospholipid synthase
MRLLSGLLRNFVTEGLLTVIDAKAKAHRFGNGANPKATVYLHDRGVANMIALHPETGLGDAYMDGRLTVDGDLWGLMELVGVNIRAHGGKWPRLFWKPMLDRLFGSRNGARRSRRYVKHHYDLSRTLYESFLDSDLNYSCAYFRDPAMSLEAAQNAKQTRIAAKLLLKRNQKVLDIGSGWGSLALHLAQSHDVFVDGITLSEEQLQAAKTRAMKADAAGRVSFALADYRSIGASYDRVVSVGMLEHVGARDLATFFAKVSESLRDDGIAVVHSIGRKDGPVPTGPWIRKHIFPGGYLPSLSETVRAIEHAGLWITDIEILRLHYAETLRHWRARFLANRDNIAAAYDERFCRMWEFYLAASEMCFRFAGLIVFQIQLAKQIDAVPLTRDYISRTEAEIAEDAVRGLLTEKIGVHAFDDGRDRVMPG